ncbi:alpha/beta hydrolase family protein [Ideonella sp.]|uniref:alpha/beta hydrolase family protein n=1 Tax=Ideonella sp. TaxID=1929293 RepID=UPI0035AF7FF0
MKALRIALLVVLLLCGLLLAYVLSRAHYPARPVGFQAVAVSAPDGTRFPVVLYYPTTARPWPTTLLGANLISVAKDGPVDGLGLPLVVISHGNEGGPGSHVDLALALAEKGFVVAAPVHPGDNAADASAVGTTAWFTGRHRDMRATLDHVLGRWTGHGHIDAAKVGVFGFSAGGFTALTTVGARPDLGRIGAHCAQAPELVCDLLTRARSPLMQAPASAGAWEGDPRVKAAVVVAPGLGFTFAGEALAGVRVPVQLWTGAADRNVPTASNAAVVATGLGQRAELHEVPGAGHFTFLAPCGLFGPPMLCADGPGIEREKLHADMNAAVADFFARTL